jgi:ubiquinol-cytochrome c reductase iron-sulfur subunit
MSDDEPKRPHRDFIVTAAMTTAGAGAALALWPFFAALGPPADIVAKRVTFDTARLIGGRPIILGVSESPVQIFFRTADELAALWNNPSVPDQRFDDGQPHPSSQPRDADNWHRSLRPEIMVCAAYCTLEPCLVRRMDGSHAEMRFDSGNLQCGCCGSWYDLAGRPYYGPARANLPVPPHRYISTTEIAFGDATYPMWRLSRLERANLPRSRRT